MTTESTTKLMQSLTVAPDGQLTVDREFIVFAGPDAQRLLPREEKVNDRGEVYTAKAMVSITAFTEDGSQVFLNADEGRAETHRTFLKFLEVPNNLRIRVLPGAHGKLNRISFRRKGDTEDTVLTTPVIELEYGGFKVAAKAVTESSVEEW